MTREIISAAVGGISTQYLEEAENHFIEKKAKNLSRRIKWIAPAAACTAVILAAVLVPSLMSSPSQAGSQPDVPPISGVEPDAGPDVSAPPPGLVLHVNEISAPDAAMHAQIALREEDFVPMTYAELLDYFGVSLPITETLPDLRYVPSSEYYGVYEQDDRGVYFDGNRILFASEDSVQRISVTFAKAFMHVYDFFNLSADELKFTPVNGRELAVFHFTNEDGESCYYTEFVQNGAAWYIATENITPEDFGKCLQSLVTEDRSAAAGGLRTVTGEITAIDPYAGIIGIRLDAGQEYPESQGITITLPEGATDPYSLYDHIKVSFYGEPATV